MAFNERIKFSFSKLTSIVFLTMLFLLQGNNVNAVTLFNIIDNLNVIGASSNNLNAYSFCQSFTPSQTAKIYSITLRGSTGGSSFKGCISDTILNTPGEINSSCLGFVTGNIAAYAETTILFSTTTPTITSGNTAYACFSQYATNGQIYYKPLSDSISILYQNGVAQTTDFLFKLVGDSDVAYCGDGTINGDEVCDDGSGNEDYGGGCLTDCTGLSGYCDDGIINGDEVCDDGELNGTIGYCNDTCDDYKLTLDFYPCQIPDNEVIQRIVGCENIYTDSTTTASQIRFFYYDIPVILLLFIFILGFVCFGIIYIFIILRKRK